MTKESLLLSIIMPVYNSEEYLEKTLLSALGSNMQNLEVIAIDDGSTDASLEILLNFQKKYNNLKILTQENSGPSVARNKGIDVAAGRFLYFLDADDLVEIDVLEKMCEKAERKKADLVISSYDIFNEYRTFKVPMMDKLSVNENIDWDDRTILWTFSLCNKLFRNAKVEELNLRFPATNYSEDGVFVMKYVFNASKIIGYDGIVFHYRRMTEGKNKSITSAVSRKKIEDYIESHQMIYDEIQKKYLSVNRKYDDFSELIKKNEDASKYSNEFLRKEINILVNQFYKFFWSLDDETIEFIVDNINMLLKKVGLKTYYDIGANIPELSLSKLPRCHNDAMDMVAVSVVLFGERENSQEFINCLRSLTLQRFVPYNIFVPKHMEDIICSNVKIRNQIQYVDAKTKDEFDKKVINNLYASYVLFADSKFLYDKSALNELYRLSTSLNVDFLTATIYIENGMQSFPCSTHGRGLLKVKNFRDGNSALKVDNILGNKFISKNFLNMVLNDCSAINPSGLYKYGYFAVTEKCYVIYNGEEKDLLKYLGCKEDSLKKDDLSELRLKDSRFLTDPLEVYKKLRLSNDKKSKWKRLLISKISRLPVKNRVLFFSIRGNKDLNDNLKIIEQQLNVKKLIVAKMLPHDSLFKLKMYYYMATSRVIVTDDYVRYLRLFPLRKEQRVIQLWHACGAFKKFGIQGTTLSLGLERSTHIQYNLVSVSSEGIRDIYANAFDIDVSHVVALGVPRTDIFFDEDAIKKRCENIYMKYPNLKEKEILLYAPTFRDKAGDRSIFKPEIDFDYISEQLNPDQVFVIAPHPVMRKKILDKEYKNIIEIRDIHTIDLMFVSNMLITDYSSVIFEYSLLNKPIVFFCYDIENYDRGFYLDYNSELPGRLVKTQEELCNCIIGQDRFELGENFNIFVNKYMGSCDGKASQRIVKLIEDYLGEKDELK